MADRDAASVDSNFQVCLRPAPRLRLFEDHPQRLGAPARFFHEAAALFEHGIGEVDHERLPRLADRPVDHLRLFGAAAAEVRIDRLLRHLI